MNNRNNTPEGNDEIRDFRSMELDEQVTDTPGGGGVGNGRQPSTDQSKVGFSGADAENDSTSNHENLNEQHNDESTSHMDYNGNSNEARPNR
jgi:hypothetical protein